MNEPVRSLSSEKDTEVEEILTVVRKIQQHKVALGALRNRRNELIKALYERGLSERQIARITGLSAPSVNQIRGDKW